MLTAPVANDGWLESEGDLLRIAEAPAPTVGKRPARACSASACACRKFASAARMFWFEMSTRAASALSSGSPNISHQRPRSIASRGSARFQPAISL